MYEQTGKDTPYAQCFNHQLHLAVVRVCERVSAVREFVRDSFQAEGATDLQNYWSSVGQYTI